MMDTTVEDDIRRLHVIGVTGVAARLGVRRTEAVPSPPNRLVLVAPRAHGVGGEFIKLPHVIGVAHRPLWSTAAARPEEIASAA